MIINKKMIRKAFEYRLYPNKQQEELILKHIGCARWIYNYALEKKMKAWNDNKINLSRFDIQKDLPLLKRQEETKWLKEVSAQSLIVSLLNLESAYKKFFKEKQGFPKFKSKHTSKQNFSIYQYTKVDFENEIVRLPKITPIKTRFHRKFKGKIKTVTVKRTPTGKYFISILVETKDNCKKKKKIKEKTAIGIDLGIKDFVVLSTGEKISNPKILKSYEEKLVRVQRRLSRKKKGSNNRNKARIKVAKVYEKITNIRKDFLHKLSHKLTHENQVSSLVVEDLNVRGMLKNRRLAKNISDCSWSEFVRQLEYKSEWYGVNLIKIDRFEPTSKLCSMCGSINSNLQLKDRNWICDNCGTNHDRDVNAATNIKRIGLKEIIPMERRESTLGENRGNNTHSPNQEAPISGVVH